MKLLLIGDIVGKPGRVAVTKLLPGLIERLALDAVLANAENAAGGSGITPAIYKEIIAAGVDGVTLGDHVYRRTEILPILEGQTNIVRPANLPPEAIGRRWAVIRGRNGVDVGFCCVLGRLFMQPADSPFLAVDQALAEIPPDVKVRIVDFHVEATSEAQLMGRYLDGRASAVLGTHTHVPTADEEVLPHGTAFQCDVGMTGPYHSIIGRRIDRVMHATLTSLPTPFEVASDDVRLCGTLVTVDPATGHALAVERVCERLGG